MFDEAKAYHQSQEYLSPTGKIKVATIEEFFSEYNGNSLIHGELEDSRAVILKFSRITSGASREWAGLTRAYSYGLSVPKPVARITREQKPTEGFIMEKIEGSTFNIQSSELLKFKLGQELKRMHTIVLPGFGAIDTDENKPQFIQMEDYIEFWLNRTLPYVSENNSVERLLKQLYRGAQSHILSQEPRFIHRDIQDNNTFESEDSRIVIIDFEWWQGGDPIDDLAVYLYHTIRLNSPLKEYQAFMQGYCGGRELSDLETHALYYYLVLAASRVVSYCSRLNRSRLGEAESDLLKVMMFIERNMLNASEEHYLNL